MQTEGGGPPMSGPANILANAHNVQITGGALSIVQGDVHNHYHGSASSASIIWRALQAIPNFRKIYLDMLSKATEGTGIWILNHEKFRIWLEPNGDIKIFWGSGMPGAGKTVLASLVIQYLDSLRQRSPSQTCVCYVYFRYSDSADLTLKGVLESLLKQTLERHPESIALVERIYSEHSREGTQPSEAQVLGLLRQLTDGMGITFYVLEALDEAPAHLRLAIVRTLVSLDVRLFITSRPLRDMQARFPAAYTLDIAAQDDDIEQHVNKGINNSSGLLNLVEQEGESLHEEILSVIKAKSSGMFLHASLQTDALRRCISLHQVRRILNSFPARIEDVYLRTWQTIHQEGEEGAELVRSVLLWVINASRSMTLKELESAVATSPSTFEFEADRVVPGSTFLAMCHGLLVVEGESQIVRLVHYTAKEHLQRLLQDHYPHPHFLLANVCLTHLERCGFQNTSIKSFEKFTAALNEDPLLSYASDAWAFHVRESLDMENVRQRVALFVSRSSAFPMTTNTAVPSSFDVLSSPHMIAFYQLPLYLISDPSYDVNIATALRKQTPLMLACMVGYNSFVEALLKRAEVQVNLTDSDGWSALMVAANRPNEHATTLLLACPETQVNLTDNDECSALFRAAYQGHEKIVARLLDRPEIEVNALNTSGWSPLLGAAYNGCEDVVLLFLSRSDVNIELITKGGWPAIICACHVGHAGVVKALLTRDDLNINHATSYGYTPLITAASQGHDEIVLLLLARSDVKVNCVDSDGCSALLLAAREGHKAVTVLLLSHAEVQVNLVSNSGRSPLIVAAQEGHESIAALLLDHPETQVNLATDAGWSALIMASYHGYETIASLIISHTRTDVNQADPNGWTPLFFAAYYNREGMAALLLGHHAIDANLAASSGWSPLMMASAEGYAGVVKALLDSGKTEVNYASSHGSTALLLAAQYGHESVVRLLLDVPDIDVAMQDKDEDTALSVASDGGHTSIVNLLREHASSGVAGVQTDSGSGSDQSESFYDAEDWNE